MYLLYESNIFNHVIRNSNLKFFGILQPEGFVYDCLLFFCVHKTEQSKNNNNIKTSKPM